MSNVECMMNERQLLNLHFLRTEPGEKLALVGDGANLIMSLLGKIMKENKGEILLNNCALDNYMSVSMIFGFIPFDPKFGNITIRYAFFCWDFF